MGVSMGRVPGGRTAWGAGSLEGVVPVVARGYTARRWTDLGLRRLIKLLRLCPSSGALEAVKDGGGRVSMERCVPGGLMAWGAGSLAGRGAGGRVGAGAGAGLDPAFAGATNRVLKAMPSPARSTRAG